MRDSFCHGRIHHQIVKAANFTKNARVEKEMIVVCRIIHVSLCAMTRIMEILLNPLVENFQSSAVENILEQNHAVPLVARYLIACHQTAHPDIPQ